MKNYGKRKIPRDVWEFDDLIGPFYKENNFSRCLDILISFWKRKGRSQSSAHSITPGVYACAFKGGLEINMNFVFSKYSINTSDFVYENLEDFLPYFYEKFILKYKSFKDFIKLYYQSIEWKIPIDLIENYKSIERLKEISPKELQYKRSWIYGIENNRQDILTNTLIEFELNKLVTIATKNFRESKGLSSETTRWVSEQHLLDKIKTTFPKEIIIGQGNPNWLENQRFDIWMPELNAAIEYNGIQHYEPVEHFGGKEGFEATKRRDELKRAKCQLNKVALLVLREGYSFKVVENWIRQQKTNHSKSNKT